MKLADRVSLRSRERKLGLFLETMQPTAATSVLDTGVDDAGFGADDGCATLNLFEERYPWPERITAVGITPGERFASTTPRSATSRRTRARSRSATASSTSTSRTP